MQFLSLPAPQQVAEWQVITLGCSSAAMFLYFEVNVCCMKLSDSSSISTDVSSATSWVTLSHCKCQFRPTPGLHCSAPNAQFVIYSSNTQGCSFRMMWLCHCAHLQSHTTPFFPRYCPALPPLSRSMTLFFKSLFDLFSLLPPPLIPLAQYYINLTNRARYMRSQAQKPPFLFHTVAL